MNRFSANRAILDWINRPRSRSDAELNGGVSNSWRPALLVGQTRFQAVFELNDERDARCLLDQIDAALADDKLHDAKRNAIGQTRKHLIEKFPDLV